MMKLSRDAPYVPYSPLSLSLCASLPFACPCLILISKLSGCAEVEGVSAIDLTRPRELGELGVAEAAVEQ